jgi:hypothetical protein
MCLKRRAIRRPPPVHRLPLAILAALLVWLLAQTVPHRPARGAQPIPSGTLCAIVYADLNANGVRDVGEPGTPDVNLSLAIQSGVIVANFVTTETTPHCVGNLPAQVEYTLRVDSPLYMTPNGNALTFALQPGERLEREVGVVARPPTTANQVRTLVIPLDRTSRLIMAAACSLVTMVLFVGVGLVLYGWLFFPRTSLTRSTGKDGGS